MSDFLTRLVERAQGVALVAQPIIPPMFAPVSPTLSDYSQNSPLESEPLNALNRAMVTPPPIDSSTATLNQSFRKTPDEDFEKPPKKRKNATKVYKEEDVMRSKSKSSDNRFVPPRHIESDLSENVEAVLPQPINNLIEHGTIKHSSSPTSLKDLTNSKRQKGDFFGNNESPTNKTVSEYNQNTSQLPEQSLGANGGVSGRLIDPDQIRVPQKLPDAEQNQNIDTRRNQQLLNEKRDASGGLIKSENESELQEVAEAKTEQNISLQPRQSRNKKRVAPEGVIDSDRAASALREVTEPIELQSAGISYLKPRSLGRIRFHQATEMEPSSESTIKVTIGRVEVRAVMPPVPIATASHARTRSPTLSLDDYLKRRNEGQL